MENAQFRILVAGGSLYAKETGIHSSCELLTVSSNGVVVHSVPFPSLNCARRGGNCLLRLAADGKNFRIWIIGGCTQLEDATVRHLDSAEYFDFYDSSTSSGNFASKEEIGNWRLMPALLNVGRSCFSAVVLPSNAAENSNARDDLLLVFGGWDGVQCVSSVECIKMNVVDDVNRRSSLLSRGDAQSSSVGGTGHSSTIVTSAIADEECVSTADLISPIKNGCCLVAPATEEDGDDVSLFLIGGWDGKRSLNTIFRYTIASRSLRPPITKLDCDTTLRQLLPYPVECHACAQQRDEIAFIIGGFDGLRVLDTIVRLDSKAGSLDLLPIKLSVARECHCAEILIPDCSNNTDDDLEPLLVVFGGWDGFKALRSVEIFRVLREYPYLVPITVKEDGLLEARNRAASVVLPNMD